jgi:two-component system sensor histidine kinase RegB
LLEVERCQEILGLMAARAGGSSEDSSGTRLAELLLSVRAQLGEERAARVEFRVDDVTAALELPLGQTTQSVVALIRNGLEASTGGAPIVVAISQREAEAHISVEDRGSGIPAPLLPRVGEPFFTTKQPGRGLGLGVFLVRAFVESRGGELIIESKQGVGTSAHMRIPLSAGLGWAAS